MIQASELKLNNWVLYDGRYFKIEALSTEYPFLNTIEFGHGVVEYNTIEPIPLTPEVLEKCGFAKVPFRENIYVTSGGNYQIAFAENRNSIFYIYIDDFKGYCYANGILYDLHQLQNLYHALTGEELTINL